MKVEQKGHITIIRDTQGDTAEFCKKLTNEHHSFKNQNLIIDLSYDKELSIADIKSFSKLAKSHLKDKKSFILVADNVNFNDVPTTLTLVPTILEAHDIIEMEEIERDLGF